MVCANQRSAARTHAATLTVDAAIDELGFGRYNVLILSLCGLTYMADAAEVLLLGAYVRVAQN